MTQIRKPHRPQADAPRRNRRRSKPVVLQTPQGEVRFRVAPSDATPKRLFVACKSCGYDPEVIPASGVCPKCGSHSWERFTLPEKLIPKHMQ
jgi:rubrerythrin